MKKTGRILSLLLALLLLLQSLTALAAPIYANVDGTEFLNVRTGPGVGHELVGKLNKGALVEVLSTQGKWAFVREISTNLTGWASLNFLKYQNGNSSNPGPKMATVYNPPPTRWLNLREYPSLDSRVLANFSTGARCHVLEELGEWVKVRISGLEGYFLRKFLIFDGENPGNSPKIYYVYSPNGKKLNLRLEPNYHSQVIGQFPAGTQVRVLSKGNGFWKVSVNGLTGYMDPKFLRPTKQNNNPGNGVIGKAIVNYTGKYLNLRERPLLSARVLGRYFGGEDLDLLGVSDNWAKVRVVRDGSVGYMLKSFITIFSSNGISTKRVVHPKGSYVNLRNKPSLRFSSVLDRVPHGSIITVLAYEGDWVKVSYNGSIGYMSKYFLR